ncbi:MAG: hypothetical protein JRE23_17380, partial [Deltaproteobacteria bacterium]|nr:hypothetical protein [Deltaproteobacteria bacterium]
DTLEDEKRQQKKYIPFERDLWGRVLPMYIEYGLNSKLITEEIPRLPEGLDVLVLFKEAQLILSESEKLDLIERKRNLGVMSLEAAYTLLHPGLDKEEVKAALEELKADENVVAAQLKIAELQAKIDVMMHDMGVVSANELRGTRFDADGNMTFTTKINPDETPILDEIDDNEG